MNIFLLGASFIGSTHDFDRKTGLGSFTCQRLTRQADLEMQTETEEPLILDR
jgi:hypothetical protein